MAISFPIKYFNLADLNCPNNPKITVNSCIDIHCKLSIKILNSPKRKVHCINILLVKLQGFSTNFGKMGETFIYKWDFSHICLHLGYSTVGGTQR